MLRAVGTMIRFVGTNRTGHWSLVTTKLVNFLSTALLDCGLRFLPGGFVSWIRFPPQAYTNIYKVSVPHDIAAHNHADRGNKSKFLVHIHLFKLKLREVMNRLVDG